MQNVVSAGQIANAIITTTSNSNSFKILNYRIGFSKSFWSMDGMAYMI